MHLRLTFITILSKEEGGRWEDGKQRTENKKVDIRDLSVETFPGIFNKKIIKGHWLMSLSSSQDSIGMTKMKQKNTEMKIEIRRGVKSESWM